MTPRFLFPLLLAVLLIASATWAYYPGLSGGFLFDDFINLPSLGNDGPVTHSATLWRYLTSGHADPTGRPLALLSFLIDARDWPAAPYPFKRTNLIIHLINGVLLMMLLYRLGQLYVGHVGSARHRLMLASILGTAFWLLHPLFVSTTLYIVQREAILPATFTLIGLLLWLAGRQSVLQGSYAIGFTSLALGLYGCSLFAMLCKANGILLPALALTIEFGLTSLSTRTTHGEPNSPQHQETSSLDLSKGKRDRALYGRAMWLLAGLPSLIITAYLMYVGWYGATHDISATRSWTLGQRLLTEPRVLMEYLKLLWLPRPFTTGLFNDHIVASASLLQPPSTLLSSLLIAALIVTAFLIRRSRPILALSILFYFVGQSMESSTIALELYFEHRNYLPTLLLFWPLAMWLCNAGPTTPHPSFGNITAIAEWRWIKTAVALLLVVGLTLMTHARASLWGNSHDQALMWAKLNPDSPRAQANAAIAETGAGHPDRAIARLQPLLHAHPDQVQIALNLLSAECAMGRIETSTLDASTRALRLTRDTGTLLTSWFEQAIGQLEDPPCREMTAEALHQLLAAARTNPNFTNLPGRRQDLDYLDGRLALATRQPDQALASFNRALDQQVRPGIALQQAALLGAARWPAHALAHLDHYETVKAQEEHPALGMPRVHAWVLERQQYWPKELSTLRHTLRGDLEAQAKRTQ